MNNSNVLNHQCRMRMVRIVLLALTTMMMATAALAAAPIVDHTWIWRADHGSGVGWNTNPSAIGLVVNGANVTIYGLFVEHFQQYQVMWNGNGGITNVINNTGGATGANVSFTPKVTNYP